jgi:hypothetical protein
LAKPFSGGREMVPKHSRLTITTCQTAGFDHVDLHAGGDLPTIPQGRNRGFDKRLGKAMIEAATALLAFLSVGVFLAHAFDAYRMR